MKEYEISIKYYNACGGPAYAQTRFDEAKLQNTDDYVRAKHGREFLQFVKEILPDGRIVYKFDNGSVTYIYEFTEL